MALKLIIVSDFVCPYCYWLETLLDRLGEQLEIIHVPYQLTEPPAPRIDVWNDPVRRVRYAETLGPVCQAQGVEMCLPPRVIPRPYTDLAFQGWCFAGERDRGESFYKAVFQAYFVDERDIGDLSVLTELAENCGLSGQDFRAALVAGTYTETVRLVPGAGPAVGQMECQAETGPGGDRHSGLEFHLPEDLFQNLIQVA